WVPRGAAAVVPLLLIAVILLQGFIRGLLVPDIQSFSGPAGPVVAGEPITLSWQVERAQRIKIDGLGGPADGSAPPPPPPPSGQRRLDGGLEKDQQFTLVAANLFGPSEQRLSVAVQTRTPTPTATPTPTETPSPTATPPVPRVLVFDVKPLVA